MTLIKSYSSPKTLTKDSPIDRKGRFAKELIKKGEIVFIKAGHIVNRKELGKYKNVINDADCRIADDFYLIPFSEKEFKELMCFVNHSCNPNIGFLGNIVMVAIKDIKAGEEICLDYAMFDNNDQKFKCNCKTEFCRKIISGRDWMRKDLQKKYGNYFSSFLLEKINHS